MTQHAGCVEQLDLSPLVDKHLPLTSTTIDNRAITVFAADEVVKFYPLRAFLAKQLTAPRVIDCELQVYKLG